MWRSLEPEKGCSLTETEMSPRPADNKRFAVSSGLKHAQENHDGVSRVE